MISFWVGLVVGLFLGVVLMCLMAIQKNEAAREADETYERIKHE